MGFNLQYKKKNSRLGNWTRMVAITGIRNTEGEVSLGAFGAGRPRARNRTHSM